MVLKEKPAQRAAKARLAIQVMKVPLVKRVNKEKEGSEVIQVHVENRAQMVLQASKVSMAQLDTLVKTDREEQLDDVAKLVIQE